MFFQGGKQADRSLNHFEFNRWFRSDAEGDWMTKAMSPSECPLEPWLLSSAVHGAADGELVGRLRELLVV